MWCFVDTGDVTGWPINSMMSVWNVVDSVFLQWPINCMVSCVVDTVFFQWPIGRMVSCVVCSLPSMAN